MFVSKSNQEEAIRLFNRAVEIGTKFKVKKDIREKVLDPKDGLKRIDYNFPQKGTNIEKLLNDFEKNIIPYSSNFGSSNFMGFEDAGNSVAGISGAILGDFLQQNLINQDFAAPFATFFDMQVILWLRKMIGYKTGKIETLENTGGLVVAGGTLSNAIGLLLAREQMYDSMESGLFSKEKKYVLVPKGLGHYSIESSLKFIGCGLNIIEVETKDYRYDLEKLKQTIEENKGNIMAIVAYAGDSRTLTIDQFEEIYNITKKIDKNIRLHADACHGSVLSFSKKHKNKLKGIELFDSITTDPHKVLATPYMMSAILFKDPKKIKLIETASSLILNNPFATGMFTPFLGSKNWMSLKLRLLIKNLGENGLNSFVDNRMDMSQYLYNILKKEDNIIIINNPSMYGIAFLVSPKKGNSTEIINDHTQKVYKRMIQEGKVLLHQFSIPADCKEFKKGEIVYPLRYMSGNDNITKDDLDDLLSYILSISKKIENG